ACRGLVVLLCVASPLAAAGQATPEPPAKPGQARPGPKQPAERQAPAAREPGRPGSFELSAAVLVFGAGTLGSSEGRLTSNQGGGGGRDFVWFQADGELRPSAGVRATIGYTLTRRFSVEGGFAYSPSRVRFGVSDDFEEAPGISSAAQRLSEYFFDGTLVAHLPWLGFAGGRGRTFVAAGAGYMRQLHEGNTLVETGQVYHVGGGVKYMLRPRKAGFVRAFGMRADGGLYLRAGGFSFDDRIARSPAATIGLIAAF
ncbi:MAG TPA: hypothetical protein VK911_07360, partial [Vicinamibacterales bacterium]|nr:hypothetical protein [Vicinamibacterales bacterium]